MGKFEIYTPGKSDKGKIDDLKRREFIKRAAIITAGLGLGMGYVATRKDREVPNRVKEKPDTDPRKKEELLPPKESVYEKPIEENPEVRIDEEGDELENEDAKTVREALDYYGRGRIEIDLDTAKKTQAIWRKKYVTDEKLRTSLESALNNIEPYLPTLREIFGKVGEETGVTIPEELIFLTIPESHFVIDAKSPKGAVGAYQLTKDTARMFGLIVNDEVDERYKPEKNAEACARNLADLYKRTKGDWNLTLAGYNGGFIWNYLSSRGRFISRVVGRNKPAYPNFLAYLSQNANAKRNFISDRKTKFYSHQVSRNDNLEKICRLFHVDKKEIKKYNRFKKEALLVNQKIKVPLGNTKTREAIFERMVAGYVENLTYPPKFYAVLDLIKEKRPNWFSNKR